MVSKYTLRNVVALILGAVLLAALFPFTSYAQVGEGSQKRPAASQGAQFCENLAAAKEKALSSLEGRKVNRVGRRGAIESKKQARLEKLNTHRGNRDNARDARYDKLRERATTDAQVAAVDDFENTVESLVVARKVSVDAAIEAFEETVTSLLEERDAAVNSYANTIEDSIIEIFDDAEEACEAETAGLEVRKQLRADLKAMREDIKADRQKYSFKDELEEARATRKAAFEAARAEFKSAYEEAKAELKAAFVTETSAEAEE